MAALLPFDIRWTPQDILRTLLDRTAGPLGFLQPQDDFPVVPVPDAAPELELPYDVLEQLVRLVDFRQKPRTREDKRGRAQGTRKLQTIRALWLHQTAALIGHDEQFLSVPTQGAVGLDAAALLLHPLRAYMFAAHAANRFSISIEVACRAAGIEGVAETFWRSKREKNGYKRRGQFIPPKSYAELVREATDDQLETTRHLVRYYVTEAERQCIPLRKDGIHAPGITEIGTHRLSHSSRVSDPGSRIYHEVILWAIREFGLLEASPVGSGRLNPTAWTGHGAEPYSWRVRGF